MIADYPCSCANSSINDCAIGSYCYEDQTCNTFALSCELNNTDSISDEACRCQTTNPNATEAECHVGQYCYGNYNISFYNLDNISFRK